MSPQLTVILVLAVLLLGSLLLRKSRSDRTVKATVAGDGTSCPNCHAAFPAEMLTRAQNVAGDQVRATLAQHHGQHVTLKLKIKMTCPQCKTVSETAATNVT